MVVVLVAIAVIVPAFARDRHGHVAARWRGGVVSAGYIDSVFLSANGACFISTALDLEHLRSP